MRNMRTFYYFILIAMTTLVTCSTNEKPHYEQIAFAIYKTVTQNKISKRFIEELKQTNIHMNSDSLSPIIAYVNADSVNTVPTINEVQFLTTVYPVDQKKKYLALVAMTKQAVLNNSDIKKTKPDGNTIEIYFNLQGAKKWADLTKNNVGSIIAFTVDDRIYTLTRVNAEIKNGMAIITGLENGEMATKISKSINASL